ncbi:MAG: hypothetical protein ACRBDL_07685 [Alphaproteobacteria bacterium]
MSFIRILFICTFLIYGSLPAHAGRPSNCGDIDRTDIKDLYQEAEDVRYIFDVREDIENSCAVFEKAEGWLERHEDELPEEDVDKLRTLLDRGYSELPGMEDPLKTLGAWQSVSADTPTQRAQRKDGLSGAKSRLRKLQDSLDFITDDITAFIKAR